MYRGVGKAAYDPMVLLKMVLYQLLLGRHSPAQWFADASRNRIMQWIGRGYVPSRRTWYAFRDRAGKFIERLHESLVRQAVLQGHAEATTGALDGSSMAACASRHRMVNGRTLRKRRAILRDILQSIDTPDPSPGWVPPTEAGRNQLAARMDRALDVLAERLKQNEARPSGKRKDPDKITVSLSDPDAPLGLDKRKTYRPLYTIQKMVDPVSHLTLSYACEARTNDAGMLAIMIDRTQAIVAGRLEIVLADGSYCTILDVADSVKRGIELIAPVSESGTTRRSESRNGQGQIPREAFRFDAEPDPSRDRENDRDRGCLCRQRRRVRPFVREERRRLWPPRYSFSHAGLPIVLRLQSA